MKKLLICLLTFTLLAASCLAEVKVESATEMERMPFLSTATNCYYQRVDGGYRIFSAEGVALSATYSDLTAKLSGLYYEYRTSGLNGTGLLDRNGQVLTAPSYAEITFADNDWALAYVLEATTEAVGDFKDSDNNQYMVQRTDVLYQGQVIGSLTREEFNPGLRWGTVGKYFYVKTTSDAGYYIDRQFNITRVDQEMSTSEFSEVYKKGIFHNPTQQWAFCEGCTLTPEDVTYSVRYDDMTDCLVDLQGNVIKSGLVFDNVRSQGDYLRIRMNGLYGVMDAQGNVVIQPAYKEILSTPFINDYQTALTEEGHLHFLDKQGNVTAKAEYPLSASDYKGAYNSGDFVVVNNMGQYIVFTATKGQLSTTYEDFSTPKTQHQLLVVKKDGLWGAIDINGNTVLPFIHRAAIELSADSTLAYGCDENRVYHLYRLSYTDDSSAAYSRETVQSGADTTDAPVLAPGAWECVCGTINTGKFCAECGSAKPEATPAPDDGSWICSCGSVNTGKFCSECGSPKPVEQAEPQCSSCGYKPEGDVPKFCPECGTKF